jgi:hypothetical protein
MPNGGPPAVLRLFLIAAVCSDCLFAGLLEDTRVPLNLVRQRSFPELAGAEVRIRAFHSQTDFFRSRFSFSRFFVPAKLPYVVSVNPMIEGRALPPDAEYAILAHELAHILQYSRGSRLRLAGLIRLSHSGAYSRWEKQADLEAIQRGYGVGLAAYREWLYKQIPPAAMAAKKRTYYTPEEIRRLSAQLAPNLH